MLPEVRLAMVEASRHYIPLDELMDGVGNRLSELTGAEWGTITCGCAAALTACTCACIAGTDLEKMTILPDTRGMKNEVIVPAGHRHTYDRAIWMVGAKMIVGETKEEMEAAVTDKTAMLVGLGAAFEDEESITLEDFVAMGKRHNVPTLVDAAAEGPDVPNIYIEAGVDMVCYSGGKALRGPQSSGLILGRKDLLKAAYMNMAPHHAFGRPMKVGKEEIMALLTAVEMWVNGRDHDAEWKEFLRKLNHIADKVSTIPSVTTELRESTGRSNKTPRVSINWDQNVIKLTSEEMEKQLINGEPRIAMSGGRGGGVSVTAWMLEEGDEIPIADRLFEILSSAV
ncbi:D-glucosaminate-6-phosphate ammonia lyase [subsurface metagenome]